MLCLSTLGSTFPTWERLDTYLHPTTQALLSKRLRPMCQCIIDLLVPNYYSTVSHMVLSENWVP